MALRHKEQPLHSLLNPFEFFSEDKQSNFLVLVAHRRLLKPLLLHRVDYLPICNPQALVSVLASRKHSLP
jgi:hypothetical protein